MLFYRHTCTDTCREICTGRQVGKIHKNLLFMEICNFAMLSAKGKIAHLCTKFLLDFGAVPAEWYIFFFILSLA